MHLKYETVRRLVTVGASADPAKALEDMRAGVHPVGAKDAENL